MSEAIANKKDGIKKERRYFALLTLVMLLIYCAIWVITKTTPFDSNNYNSYSLQAQSWLSGRLDVDYFPWLEQATYGGKYFISFPPLPSVVMLPFVLIFGAKTPDNIICLFVTLGGVYFAYKSAIALGQPPKKAFFWTLLLTFASNFLFIAINGWVWFIAQNLSFMFSMGAIYAALRKKGGLSMFLLACAVGCRPIQLAFFPVIFYLLFDHSGVKGFFKDVIKKWYSFIPAGCVAVFLCGLNYARFGSIFEFGHNYLPEFLQSPKGQFDISYIPYNLMRSVRLAQYSNGNFSFPRFDGFAFYIVMPIWISCLVHLIKKGRPTAFTWITIACILINLLITCAHKTMGGWHFGCRYFIDATPFVYLLTLKKEGNQPAPKLGRLDYILIAAGLIINIAGTSVFYMK